jgi:hypothetical protein
MHKIIITYAPDGRHEDHVGNAPKGFVRPESIVKRGVSIIREYYKAGVLFSRETQYGGAKTVLEWFHASDYHRKERYYGHQLRAIKWFKGGVLHNEQGPAVCYSGSEQYWLGGLPAKKADVVYLACRDVIPIVVLRQILYYFFSAKDWNSSLALMAPGPPGAYCSSIGSRFNRRRMLAKCRSARNDANSTVGWRRCIRCNETYCLHLAPCTYTHA